MSFEGKVAIVTGGASGIGEAVARMLAAKGAKVVVADYNPELGEKVANEVGGEFFRIDVGDPEQNKAMVGFAVENFGRLDYAVNNAGISGPIGLPHEVEVDDYKRLIDVNLNSVFYAMKYEVPEILKTGGAIVNMSSILGLVAEPTAAAYTTAKHGLNGMTKAFAAAYASQGIRVNTVHPGYIKTPLLDPATFDYLITKHPIGRLGEADEVAALTVFLLSDEASFITGTQHVVDGGYTSI